MHLTFDNINDAFHRVVRGIQSGKIPTTPSPSRYGDVKVITEPVIVTYRHPLDRVLFNEARDCNHFFHLFEILWMLAGRKDVAPLAYYSSNMPTFSDDGETFWGAYGARWRKHFGYDQLAWIVDELRANPTSRRCVLQMWDGGQVRDNGEPREFSADLYMATHGGKDVPCNVCAFFLVNPATKRLDLTVINRSNDLVWGMFGANVVQMSTLLEYVACCIGVPVGVYHQVTNNGHVYDKTFTPDKWIDTVTTDAEWMRSGTLYDGPNTQIPLVSDPVTFDRECAAFIEDFDRDWKEPYLEHVVKPMMKAFKLHKERRYDAAMATVSTVASDDWRVAGTSWLERRKFMWLSKQEQTANA